MAVAGITAWGHFFDKRPLSKHSLIFLFDVQVIALFSFDPHHALTNASHLEGLGFESHFWSVCEECACCPHVLGGVSLVSFDSPKMAADEELTPSSGEYSICVLLLKWRTTRHQVLHPENLRSFIQFLTLETPSD